MTAPAPDSLTDPESLRERALDALVTARDRTALLTSCVEDPDLTAQHSPLMSPLVWDLAHIGNQEELWLLRAVAGREALRPEIDGLYDAFEHARSERPKLPLLPPAEARTYAAEVRGRALDVLESSAFRGSRLTEAGFAFGMIAQHEQQHDETMLITHQLRRGLAALTAPDPAPVAPFTGLARSPGARRPVRDGHLHRTLGARQRASRAPAYGPVVPHRHDAGHQRRLPGLHGGRRLRRPSLVDAGGLGPHPDARHRGAAVLAARGRSVAAAALRRHRGRAARRARSARVLVRGRRVRPLGGWRLPTEAEWEKAARHDPVSDRSTRYPWGDADPTPEHANLGQRHLRPAPAGSYPAGASPLGVRQLIGDVWEWTSSDLEPYPGFAAFPYREYSEVFFGPDHKVLRGGSFAVDQVACRGTFRNWDYPIRRQIFAGFRTARDGSS